MRFPSFYWPLPEVWIIAGSVSCTARPGTGDAARTRQLITGSGTRAGVCGSAVEGGDVDADGTIRRTPRQQAPLPPRTRRAPRAPLRPAQRLQGRHRALRIDTILPITGSSSPSAFSGGGCPYLRHDDRCQRSKKPPIHVIER
jgi:hypothetical protein